MNNKNSCLTKTCSKLKIEGIFLIMIRNIYQTPTTNSELNGKFPLRSREGCPGTALLFIVLVVLVSAVIQNAYTFTHMPVCIPPSMHSYMYTGTFLKFKDLSGIYETIIVCV